MWHNANSISKLKLTGLLIRLSTNHPLCFYRPESRLYFHKMQHKPFVYTCKLRNHLKRNHFIVRCKLILRSYLEVLCQGTELVVCLLLSTNKHHVKHKCTNIWHDTTHDARTWKILCSAWREFKKATQQIRLILIRKIKDEAICELQFQKRIF